MKMLNKLKQIDKRYLIILLAALIIFTPYLSNKFIEGDDFICHISNLFSMNDNMSLSNIRSVIAQNFGYGNGIFYPQLPYIITFVIYNIVKVFGGTLITAVKIFEFLVIYLSGLFMYKFMIKTFNNKDVSLISSLLYMFSPYFICDVFVRMAYGEMTLFVFIPIVMLSITYLLKKEYNKFLFCFVLGFSACMYSHLVMAVYLTILVIIVLLINIKQILNKKSIIYLIIGAIMILCLTSFFIVPMIEHKLKGDYVVFLIENMASLKGLKDASLSIFSLVNRFESYRTVFYYTSFSIVLLGIIAIYNRKKIFGDLDKLQKRYIISLIAFSICAFFIGSQFMTWSIVPELLWSIQFPWRMTTFLVFGLSALAGFGVLAIKNKKAVLVVICVIGIIDLGWVLTKRPLKNVEVPNYDRVFNVDSGALGWQQEYLPIKSKNNIDYLKSRTDGIVIKEQVDAKTEIIENNVPYLKFKIETNTDEKIKLELPRLFYFGYEIKYEGSNEKIAYYENENGFIEFEVNKSGTIIVDYRGTTIDKISRCISILTLLVYIYMVGKFIWNSRRKDEF